MLGKDRCTPSGGVATPDPSTHTARPAGRAQCRRAWGWRHLGPPCWGLQAVVHKLVEGHVIAVCDTRE